MNDYPDIDEDRRDAFLADLSALTMKHGIGIAACGCCGSPWLTRAEDKKGAYEVEAAGSTWERLQFVSPDSNGHLLRQKD